MNFMSIELKIKSKHLGLEAGVIRHEERTLRLMIDYARRHNKNTLNFLESKWYSINQHRRWDVRNENRATFLARAFLEGKPYKEVEQKRKPENEYKFQQYIIPRVAAMVNKYNDRKEVYTEKFIQDWSKLE